MQRLRFTVPGPPVPKGRPRAVMAGAHPRVVTPGKTRRAERAIAKAGRAAMTGPPLTGALFVHIDAFFEVAASWSGAKKRRHLGQPHAIRGSGDWDNLGKLVCDALEGVAFADDAQIASASVTKWWSDRPRTEISVMPLEMGALGLAADAARDGAA